MSTERHIIHRNDGAALVTEVMHGEDAGHPMVVCWPGAGQGAAAFTGLGKSLVSEGWTAVLISPRGTGGSDPPTGAETMADLVDDARRAIAALARRPAVMLGAAFGNRVARAVSKHQASLVCGTILLAAGGEIEPTSAVAKAFLSKLRASTDPALQMCVRIAAITPHSYYGDGGEQPMLILQGIEDQIAPRENGARIAARGRQRVTLLELEGVGHAFYSQRPELASQYLLGWLESTMSNSDI